MGPSCGMCSFMGGLSLGPPPNTKTHPNKNTDHQNRKPSGTSFLQSPTGEIMATKVKGLEQPNISPGPHLPGHAGTGMSAAERQGVWGWICHPQLCQALSLRDA